MKKKLLAVIIAVLCALPLFSGCGMGTYIQNNKPKDPIISNPSNPSDPSDPSDPENPDEPDEPIIPSSHYTAAVYYKNKLFKPEDLSINVVWRSETSITKVALDADGRADAGELDGDFNVYLEGLPDTYVYNPGGTTVTDESRKATILLEDIKTPESGDGRGLYVSQGCYTVKYDGTYRAQISKAGEYRYYQYTPTAAGWYKIESWVNVYDDEINPFIMPYSGSHAYKTPSGNIIDDGGFSLSGGYTKNFRYDCRVDKSEVGNSFTIAVTAESKSGTFPLTVDFAITYVGEYQNEYSDLRVVRAKEAKVKAAEKKEDEEFIYADMGTKTFAVTYTEEDSATGLETTKYNYMYNEDTGFYHRYSETLYADDPYGYGKNFGPILCCMIYKSIPSYTVVESLYVANDVGPNHSNYLMMFLSWLEDEKKYVTKDYTDFIRTDYFGKCNSDGVCYVTKELQEFLQDFAKNHSLYADGRDTAFGSPEDLGYFARQDSLWLFACGFYEKP